MNKRKLTVLIPLLLSAGAFAKSPTTNWDSDVVENYLAPGKGNTVAKLSDVDNNSRWYSTVRLKSGLHFRDDSRKQFLLQGNLRLRGKTMLTDDIGYIGDFWLQAQENYVETDAGVQNPLEGELDDSIKWEQFRTGFESDTLGALMFAKHTATWGIFVTDIGVQGLYDTQGDVGAKNADKLIYKHQLDNNLFINASYDMHSEITGLDLGYQTADIYSYTPDSYGVYFSVHNGQPMLENGAGDFLIGNVDTTTDIKSDSVFNRHDDSQYTYSISGYRQIGFEHKFAANISYSDRDESVDVIKANGVTTGGLGLSATASYQMFAEGFTGFSPILTVSHDEFGSTIAPEVQYFFKPYVRAWIAHVINTDGDDITKLEFQADF